MTYYWQFTQSRSVRSKWWVIVTPYKIKKECYHLKSWLVGTRRMLLFVIEWVFLPRGEVWLMHNADTQCTVEGREKAKGQKKVFMFKFFLPCHKIWILFHNFPPLIINLLIESTRWSNIWSFDARLVACLSWVHHVPQCWVLIDWFSCFGGVILAECFARTDSQF